MKETIAEIRELAELLEEVARKLLKAGYEYEYEELYSTIRPIERVAESLEDSC